MKEWFEQIMRLQEESKNNGTNTNNGNNSNQPVIPFFHRLPPENAFKALLNYASSDDGYSSPRLDYSSL